MPLLNLGSCSTGPEGQYSVVRYHSLVVDEATLPPHLPAIAWTCGSHQALRPAHCSQAAAPTEPLVMAIAHQQQPLFGVQFHPESVATAFGEALLANFRDITAAHRSLVVPASVSLNTNGEPSARLHMLNSPAAADVKRCCMGVFPHLWLQRAGHAQRQSEPQAGGTANLAVRWTCLPALLRGSADGESIFRALYGAHGGLHTFWLDR